MDEIRPGYTRVTEILDQWNTKVEVDGETVAKAFAGSKMAIDISVLNNKAQLGTNVHRAIEAELEGFEIPLSEKERLYFQSYLKWKEKAKITFVESEQRYYCDTLKITGCVDAIIKYPTSEDLIILDFKTSAKESPKIWPLQATFYRYLASINGMKLSNRMLFLQLDRKGDIAQEYEYEYSNYLLEICHNACFSYRYLNS